VVEALGVTTPRRYRNVPFFLRRTLDYASSRGDRRFAAPPSVRQRSLTKAPGRA